MCLQYNYNKSVRQAIAHNCNSGGFPKSNKALYFNSGGFPKSNKTLYFNVLLDFGETSRMPGPIDFQCFTVCFCFLQAEERIQMIFLVIDSMPQMLSIELNLHWCWNIPLKEVCSAELLLKKKKKSQKALAFFLDNNFFVSLLSIIWGYKESCLHAINFPPHCSFQLHLSLFSPSFFSPLHIVSQCDSSVPVHIIFVFPSLLYILYPYVQRYLLSVM